MKFLSTAIMALALFALAACGGSQTTALPATQNAPAFSTPAATDFVKSLSQTANDYVTSIKAKDAAKTAALTSKFNEVLGKINAAAAGLKPDEVKKLQDWANSLIQQTREGAAAAAAAAAAPAK